MQRVRRIEEFFATGEHAPHTFFCVDWAHRPFTATWQRERPERAPDFEAQVVWKEMGRVVTLCALNLADEEAAPPDERVYQDKTLVSLLKSNLQKCVRRQLTRRATETARYLLALDAGLFVRRLLIIMLEDVVLHESAGVLVWLTAALSKQFRLSGAMQAWLLGLTETLCREPEEAYWTHGIDNTMRDITPTQVRRLWTECEDDDACRDTVYALLFRLSYGGLPGDLSMLLSFAQLVRAHGGACISRRAIIDLAPGAVWRLDLAQVEPCAVDFHCLPNLIFILARQYRQYSEQQIKQAVWHHSSKLNTRIARQTEEQATKTRAAAVCYCAIRQRLEYLQRQHIKVCANTVVYKQFLLAKGTP